MKIKATLLKILYPKETSAESASPIWYVLATTAGRTVGATRITPRQGHAYTFEGDYEIYQGQQNFKFRSMVEDIPVSPQAILDYACAVTKGLGPAFAQKIWDKYGPAYQERLGKNPEGQKEEALAKTLEALAKTGARAKTIAALISCGLTQLVAEQAVASFGEETLSLFNQNPYLLSNLPGQSFKTIDARIREPLKIDPLDARRLTAFLDHAIRKCAETEGSTLIDTPILTHLREILPQGVAIPENVHDELIGRYPRMTLDGAEAYTHPSLLKTERALFRFLSSSSIAEPTAKTPVAENLNQDQRAAVARAASATGFILVNGGAGTGKTTAIKAMAQTIEAQKRAVKIVAFAGRAAARVREATGFPATTIHALLGYMGEGTFAAGDFPPGTAIIIDEASMVPAWLLAEICKRKPQTVILVGDEAQLPPVGSGAPFHDIAKRCPRLTTTLNICYRNTEAIFAAAAAIRQGRPPEENITSENERFIVSHIRSPREAQDVALKCLPSLDFRQDVIIAPRNGRDEPNLTATAASVNRAIEERLSLPFPSVGSRLICLKNDPQKDVWNGTVGTVSAIDIDGNAYLSVDGAHEAKLTAKYVRESTAPAYAITIHKAQGSQYRRVVIIALARDLQTLLDRKMLYTAITRAKKDCLIVTDLNLADVIRRNPSRKTVLSAFIQEEGAQ